MTRHHVLHEFIRSTAVALAPLQAMFNAIERGEPIHVAFNTLIERYAVHEEF